jgi:hypothetical protein
VRLRAPAQVFVQTSEKPHEYSKGKQVCQANRLEKTALCGILTAACACGKGFGESSGNNFPPVGLLRPEKTIFFGSRLPWTVRYNIQDWANFSREVSTYGHIE